MWPTDLAGRHRAPHPKPSEMYGLVLEKHTFLLLTDFAGKHMAGQRAPPEAKWNVRFCIGKKHIVGKAYIFVADGFCRQARGWLARPLLEKWNVRFCTEKAYISMADGYLLKDISWRILLLTDDEETGEGGGEGEGEVVGKVKQGPNL